MMTGEQIVNELPEKGANPDTHRMTTTRKFKLDVFNFFNQPEFRDKICLELGCWDCYSSVMLSHLFREVYALQQMYRTEAVATIAKYERKNIILVVHDLYRGTPIPVDRADVIFIDAEHTYECVKSDVMNSLKLPSVGKKYFVFDDYGIIAGVRNAINDLIADGTLKLVQKVGWKKHTPDFPAIITLDDDEGVICVEA